MYMYTVVASGHRGGSLYYLDHGGPTHQAYLSQGDKAAIWHCRLGHLGNAGMKELNRLKMVKGLDHVSE